MKSIAVIHNMPFPEGFAPTVRLTAYSRGLIEAGCNLRIFCIKPKEVPGQVKNVQPSGNYLGIPYNYTSGTNIRSLNLATRIFFNMKGFWNSILQLAFMKRNEGLDVLLLIGPLGFFKEWLYFLATRLLGAKILQERTEYPFLTQKPSGWFRLQLWFYLHISCKLYDGMLVISQTLADYFNRYLSAKASVFVMPILVDAARFDRRPNESQSFDYIAYCGSMESNKDGIEYLLEAFKLISGEYDGIRLVLIGRTDFKGFGRLQELVTALGLPEKVIFTGRVDNEEMASWLKGAKMLVLARPKTIQSEANFPTKIGEYLATGNPVLTTRVGAVAAHLIDQENAFLAEPGDAEDFARKMAWVLEHPEQAGAAGLKGRALAYTVFNYKVQAERLLVFLENL